MLFHHWTRRFVRDRIKRYREKVDSTLQAVLRDVVKNYLTMAFKRVECIDVSFVTDCRRERYSGISEERSGVDHMVMPRRSDMHILSFKEILFDQERVNETVGPAVKRELSIAKLEVFEMSERAK